MTPDPPPEVVRARKLLVLLSAIASEVPGGIPGTRDSSGRYVLTRLRGERHVFWAPLAWCESDDWEPPEGVNTGQKNS